MRTPGRPPRPGPAGLLLAITALGGCGADAVNYAEGGDDDGDSGGSDAAPGGFCFSSNECPPGLECNEFGFCQLPASPPPDGGAAPPPPETERDLGTPESALRYLYVAMPDLDALAKIDGATLSVTSVAVGDRPGLVVALPATDDALVLDRGSSTATIVRPTVDRDEKITLPTLPRVNAVAVDPTGRYAVAWFDLTRAVAEAGGLANVGEIGSFQDVTVLSLGRGEEAAGDLAVGFRPRGVLFSADGAQAFVITDDGVSRVDLAAAAAGTQHVAATIPVAASPLSDPARIEVAVTPDGAWALVREAGRAELRLVSLAPGTSATHVLPLPGEATDVDLDASGAHAYAVLRETSQLVIVDVPGDLQAPAGARVVDLEGAVVGSVVIDAARGRALLYTNAIYKEELVVVDLDSEAVSRWPLQKGVRSVTIAPGGEAALVLHTRLPGDPFESGDVETYVDRSPGYSLVKLADGFAKVVITPVEPGGLAFAPAGQPFGYVALDGGDAEDAVRRLHVIDLEKFIVSDVPLGSPPEAVGVLPMAGVAFVAQRHALGRVTFVAWDGATTRTITGYELGAQIVD